MFCKTVKLIIVFSVFFTACSRGEIKKVEESYSSKNRLGDSSSLYLTQHSTNPVNWLPWSEKAFEEAQRLDKPVLVSIGYSTCHWCHVMEEVNFSDKQVAELMNDKFINIKVDREEMPAIDSLYMDAVQAMTGQGGWPLHVFLDHKKHPFFGGTYFPKDAWMNVLNQLSHTWENERAKIDSVSENVSTWFNRKDAHSLTKIPDNPAAFFKDHLLQFYDNQNPGFNWSGGGHKFPPTGVLTALLESGDKESYKISENILETMMGAGLHDRVGGGFHRYATDTQWRVPHFEKMLYDNAQLMGIYARAGSLLNRADFTETAESIAQYLKRDMKVFRNSEFIGYASAEDADDLRGEGSFYSWPPDEIKEIFPGKEGEELLLLWDLTGKGRIKDGDFEPVKGWIPHPGVSSAMSEVSITDEQLKEMKEKLRVIREKRPSPVRDDKVLTDLNALALEGFSLLARYTGKDEYIQDVIELSDLLIKNLNKHGVMRGEGIDPFITDYAFLILGFTAAYSVTGDPSLITAAEKAALQAVKDLYAEEGYFYSTAEKREDLFIRRPDTMDNQIPSGQNALLLGFSRLYLITGDEKWNDYSLGIISHQADLFSKIPAQFSTMLQALMMRENGWHAVITGDPENSDFIKINEALLKSTGADFPVITAEKAHQMNWETFVGRRSIKEIQVLLCSSSSCRAPVSEIKDLYDLLKENRIY